jgi:hypothetical protein
LSDGRNNLSLTGGKVQDFVEDMRRRSVIGPRCG